MLSPTFISNVQSYKSSVTNRIDGVSVIPTLADEKATVRVGVNGGKLKTVSSGSTSGTLPLNVGENVLNVLVTAKDGTSRSNTIAVTRQVETGAEPQVPVCTFTDIQQHWAKAEICEAAGLGIVEGVSTNTFVPDRAVTRTEFALMLLRVFQIPISEQSDTQWL